VFQHFCPDFDFDAERQARLDAGLGQYLKDKDLYPDVRPCLHTLQDAGYFVGIAGNQTTRAGRFLHELNLPCDTLATSDDWGVTKSDVAFFSKPIAISSHQPNEIAYVGDRLDNNLRPAAAAGLHTIFVRRGPWATSRTSAAPRISKSAHSPSSPLHSRRLAFGEVKSGQW
jgi:FMN phosphatase YigB (HAD superfamily)